MTTWQKSAIRQQQAAGTYTYPKPPLLPSEQPRARLESPTRTSGDVATQSAVVFSHPQASIGTLTIETGMDIAQWGYNLNTQVYPTYGGEVVQILSVYIDDLQLGGSLTTYSQMEAIYSYFSTYMQIATQGRNPTPNAGVSAYNLQPMKFTYPARNWEFEIYPMTVPGFYMGEDVVAPNWQMTAHVIDDSQNTNPTLTSIKAQITDATINAGLETFSKINDEISPDMRDPNTMPFMVFTGNSDAAIGNYADYYNSQLSSYAGVDPSTIPGSAPVTPSQPSPAKPKVKAFKPTHRVGKFSG